MLSIVHICLVSSSRIDYVTTVKGGTWNDNLGSIEGGSLLWIIGEGFASSEFSANLSATTTNLVKLRNSLSAYDCPLYNDEMMTSDTQLVCSVPAMPEGSYLTEVYIHGNENRISNYTNIGRANYQSSRARTPQINGITRATGSPQRLVVISGNFHTSRYLYDVTQLPSETTPVISR